MADDSEQEQFGFFNPVVKVDTDADKLITRRVHSDGAISWLVNSNELIGKNLESAYGLGYYNGLHVGFNRGRDWQRNPNRIEKSHRNA